MQCLSGHPEEDSLVLSETEEVDQKEGGEDEEAEEEEEEEERISKPCGTASPRDQERIVGGSQVSNNSVYFIFTNSALGPSWS